MSILKIFVPGRFEDAYAYMGRLVVLTEDRTIRIYSLEQIVSSIERSSPELTAIPTLMFLRNDWLTGQQFESISSNEGVAYSLVRALDSFAQPFLEIQADDFEVDETSLGIDADVLLDWLIYNKRLYVGASNGLYHVDVDWSADDTSIIGRPERRIDARCIGVSASYGAISASCGVDGLFTAVDEFAWGGLRHRQDMERIADRSVRTAWLDYDLVNYPTQTLPSLHRTEREKVSATSDEHEHTMLTRINTEHLDLGFFLDELRGEYGVEQDSLQYVYNSRHVLFAHTLDGRFYSIGVRLGDHSEPELRFTRTYKRDDGGMPRRILSVNPTTTGLVVETDDCVLLFANGRWLHIVDSEVLSVRTFMARARRYKNLATITTEDGVFLVSLFDDSKLRRSASVDWVDEPT